VSGKSLLVVQPWFVALGHPAQSTLNTAAALDGVVQADYLVSYRPGSSAHSELFSRLNARGGVHSFGVCSTSVREGTLRAFLALWRLRQAGYRYHHIFFLDAHLPTLALLWPLVRSYVPSEQVSAIYLKGPERILGSLIVGNLVRCFLTRSDAILFLRTQELLEAWRSAFHTLPERTFALLPSLEIPEDDVDCAAPVGGNQLRFGILGQLRREKGLETLIPMYSAHPDLGKLTIAGAFNSSADRDELMPLLQAVESFKERFLTEAELLTLAKRQDYLLMLYEPWDARLESAVLYLAARAHRPVVTYDDGWCGRMLRTFGCGIAVPKGTKDLREMLAGLPRPGSREYADLLLGVAAFRDAHSPKRLAPRFLNALLNSHRVPR
jgi:hypothetical protein